MAVKIITSEEKRTTFHKDILLDTSRDTAILIRQSGRGANIKHYESRLLQESLIPFVMEARGESDLTHIRIYDEGAGVSGRKGIDKRLILRQLHYDLAAGLIGDIIVARADRLFRDKHFDKVSTFTMLAEKMGIKVIVPTSRGAVVYDFRSTKDLQTFQQDMQAAYSYIENQIGYMNRARDAKKARGLYGGGCLPLPLVLLRDIEKDEQKPVVYPEWRPYAIDLFTQLKDFNYEIGRLYRYVENLPFVFPDMTEADKEVYIALTNMKKVAGGYTFSNPTRLRGYMSNLVLAGYAPGGTDEEGNTVYIEDAWDAAIPRDLFEPAYAAITGEYIDGTPFTEQGSNRQFRRNEYETDAILHGFLTSDDGIISTFAQNDDQYPIYACLKGGYLGQTTRAGLGRILKVWTLPCREVDKIVLERLIALAEYDVSLVDRLKKYFETVSKNDESKLSVLDTAIKKTQTALKKISKAIVLLSKSEDEGEEEGEDEKEQELALDDPLVKEHRKLSSTLRTLLKQREEAARESQEDPAKSIEDFYHVLSHLRAEFNKKPPQKKKDIIRKLVSEVKISTISPHLYTLHITWIQPVAADRVDVALLWRSNPTKTEITTIWTEEEEETLRALYPDSPQLTLMQAIPNKSYAQIRHRASQLQVRRTIAMARCFWWTVAYTDLAVAAQFTDSTEQRDLLWEEINAMAEKTQRKGFSRNLLSALWFLPVDIVSFSHDLCVTGVNESGMSLRMS